MDLGSSGEEEFAVRIGSAPRGGGGGGGLSNTDVYIHLERGYTEACATEEDVQARALAGSKRKRQPLKDGTLDAAHVELPDHGGAGAAPIPYLMNLAEQPKYAIRSFVPMWKKLKRRNDETPEGVLTKILQRFKSQICTWHGNSDKEPTHVALNQGKFYIPSGEQEDQFIRGLAYALASGHDMWFTEIKTPVYRYFMDLDLLQLKGVREQDIEAAVYIVQQAVKKFFPGKDGSFFKAIVCSTGYKEQPAKDDKPDMVKTGVHIIWVNIFLNNAIAMNIRETVIANLAEAFGVRAEPANDWEDVVDLTVYKGSGLRMLGNRKTEICKVCKRKRKDASGKDCAACDGNGQVDTGRPYMPMFVTDGNGRRDVAAEALYQLDFLQLLKDTKVRTALQELPADLGFVMPEGAPAYLDEGSGGGPKKKKRGSAAAAGAGSAAAATGAVDLAANPRGMSVRLNRSDELCEQVEAFIRETAGAPYAEVQVSQLSTNAARTCYLVNLRGPGCQYCYNVGRAHASNRVYFMLTPQGMVQRCHDSTNSAGDTKFGPCATYRSATMPLHERLAVALFPKVAAKAAELEGGGGGHGGHGGFGEGEGFGGAGEGEEDEVSLVEDRRVQSLLTWGDKLCTELFGSDWAPTVGSKNRCLVRSGDSLQMAQRTGMLKAAQRLSKYVEVDPTAIGSKADNVLQALGLLQNPAGLLEEAHLLHAEEAMAAVSNRAIARIKPTRGLEPLLLHRAASIVELAASLDGAAVSEAIQSKGLEGLKELLCSGAPSGAPPGALKSSGAPAAAAQARPSAKPRSKLREHVDVL